MTKNKSLFSINIQTRKIISFLALFVILSGSGPIANAQQLLWFGTLKMDGKVKQGRFEVYKDSVIKKIMYAPYGITPVEFKNVQQRKNQLTFTWAQGESIYRCFLVSKNNTAYAGSCTCENREPIELVIREVTAEDAMLQGDTIQANQQDIQILDRALNLLNNGKNWDRSDNRVCDASSYPYHWSLFCALHQASIDVDLEYRHLRPAIAAARQAIGEITSGKKYAHLLQDFNNEAENFQLIATVLDRAKQIIQERIQKRQ